MLTVVSVCMRIDSRHGCSCG